MSLVFGEAPLVRAPSIERRQFVPWFAVNDRELLADVEFGPDLMMAASSLHDAHFSRALREWVRNVLGLAWALHPQLELLQLEDDFIETREPRHRFKLVSCRELLVEAIGEFDPRVERFSRRHAREASGALLQRAVGALGTGLISGAFVLDDLSPSLLANNLALLDGAIDEFDEEQLEQPVVDDARFAMPRQLFAGVSVHARLLDERRFVRRLLDELVDRADGLYGYWVQVPGLTTRASAVTIAALREFLYPLQERSERPVVPDRIGGFGLGFLAGGVAGYCIGTAAPEFVSFPPSYRVARDPEDASAKNDGFAFVSYNQILMRNFHLRGKRAGKGLLAAHRFPCGGCGHHEPDSPPRNNREKKLHGFFWHQEHGRRLSRGLPTQTSADFRRMIALADESSRAMGDSTPFYAAMLETLPPEAAARTGTD